MEKHAIYRRFVLVPLSPVGHQEESESSFDQWILNPNIYPIPLDDLNYVASESDYEG